MSLDHQIADAIAAATKQISAQIEERLRGLGSDIGQAASAERVSIVREIRVAAESEVAKKSQEAVSAAQAEHARRLDEAVAAAKAEAARRLDEALAVARVEQAKRVEEATSAARADLQRRIDEAVAVARADWARQHDADKAEWLRRHDADLADCERRHQAELAERVRRHEADLRAAREAGAREAEAELSRTHQTAIATAVAAAAASAARESAADHSRRLDAAVAEALDRARAEHEARVAEAIDAARHEARAEAESACLEAQAAERQAELALVERLADDVRRLDDARSLTDILDRLTTSVAAAAPRAAMFVVRGSRAAGWRFAGFPDEADPRRLEFGVDAPNLVARAIGAGRPVTTSDPSPVGHPALSPFGELPPQRAGVAVPIRVGGETVAVLYADDAAAGGRETPSAWPEIAELLCRHAARCLEVLTVTRAVQTAVPASVSAPAPRYAAQSRVAAQGSVEDEEAARRYAKLLVSEIKLYHEAAVSQGRRDRNLVERLRPEIERARRLYEDRIPAETRARGDFFGQELIRTLASGDPSLLGGR